jgi:hypothetical protein
MIHFFLWLLCQNKLLTRDNLGKRRPVGDPSCMFFNENESVFHLFFGCAVASRIWELVSRVVGISMGNDYESVARLWLCNKRCGIINIISSAVCWCLWELMNHLCFQDGKWSSLRMFWRRLVAMLENFGLGRETGWLRLCYCSAGELGREIGADLAGSVGMP